MSFGFRDGWAVGVTGDYAEGVSIGNADGKGRAGLTGASVFWHLDGVFIGTTRGTHRWAVKAPQGAHVLTTVDDNGHSLEESFTVISAL